MPNRAKPDLASAGTNLARGSLNLPRPRPAEPSRVSTPTCPVAPTPSLGEPSRAMSRLILSCPARRSRTEGNLDRPRLAKTHLVPPRPTSPILATPNLGESCPALSCHIQPCRSKPRLDQPDLDQPHRAAGELCRTKSRPTTPYPAEPYRAAAAPRGALPTHQAAPRLALTHQDRPRLGEP